MYRQVGAKSSPNISQGSVAKCLRIGGILMKTLLQIYCYSPHWVTGQSIAGLFKLTELITSISYCTLYNRSVRSSVITPHRCRNLLVIYWRKTAVFSWKKNHHFNRVPRTHIISLLTEIHRENICLLYFVLWELRAGCVQFCIYLSLRFSNAQFVITDATIVTVVCIHG